MGLRRIFFVVLVCFSGCGIKAPPRPPLDEPPSTLVDAPDAGCCAEVNPRVKQ